MRRPGVVMAGVIAVMSVMVVSCGSDGDGGEVLALHSAEFLNGADGPGEDPWVAGAIDRASSTTVCTRSEEYGC